MTKSKRIVFLCAAVLVVLLALIGKAVVAGRVLAFDGGPSGGVYTIFAEGIARLLAREEPATPIRVSPSAGSVSNLLRLDAGTIDMAIAGEADILQGRQGKLPSYPAMLNNVVAVTRLYDEYAQLAVLANSPVRTVEDLAGARVAVGTLGSGTLAAARRFFQAAGLWDRIKPQYASFDLAADDFIGGRVEAIWLMSGCPSASLLAIARKAPIRLIDLGAPAARSRLFIDHPSYTPGTLPAGTYPGLDTQVTTFRDPAVWVAACSVNADFIYQALRRLYSPEGIAFMRQVHPVARQLDPDRGKEVAGLEFHPGASRFWEERSAQPSPHPGK